MLKKIFDPILKAIRGGIIYILSGSILTKAITMLSSIILVRLISKELNAYYSYATNIFSYVELLNGLELSSALLIMGAKAKSRKLDRAYFTYATGTGALFQLLLSTAICVVIYFIRIPYPEAKKYIYYYALLPTLSVIIHNIQSYNRAHLQNKRYSAMGVVRAAIICAVGLLLIPVMKVEGMIISRYIAAIVVIYIGGRYCYSNLKDIKPICLNRTQKNEMLKLSFSMLVASFFSYLMPVNETFLVNNILQDITTSANFKVAGLIPQQLSIISGGICIYFYPSVAKEKNFNIVKKKVISIGIYTFAAVLCVALFGVIFTPFMIKVLYGKQYLDAVGISRTLWFMRMINSAYRTVPVTFLPAIGDTKFNFISSPVFCIFHFIIDYFMITRIGIMGVAYATMLVYFFSGTVAWIYFLRICNRKDSIQRRQV